MKTTIIVLILSFSQTLESYYQVVQPYYLIVQEESVEISDAGLDLIKQFEGFRSHPYLDSGGIPTIGFGTVVYPNGLRVTMNDPQITQAEALDYLKNNVDKKCESINGMVKTSLNQNQFDALCSFAYNLGVTALHNSTLLKLVNESKFDDAAKEFHKWTHDNGRVLPGLTIRRQAESDLFTSEDTDVAAR